MTNWTRTLTPAELAIQAADKTLLQEIGRNSAGFILSNYHWDEQLELYFDIERKGKSDCYISKGWDQPGFRVSAIVDIPLTREFDWNFFDYVSDYCAVNGVALTRQPEGSIVGWMLDSVIYSGALNAESFTGSVDSMLECIQQIRLLAVAFLLKIPPDPAISC